MNLAEKVRALIIKEKLISKGDNVLVGVSGGIDSTVLLHILVSVHKRLACTIGVAHINHLLRGEESERDEAFVAELARSYGLPYHVKKIDVKGYAKTHGMSLQHAARDMRYSFFQEIAEKHSYNKIAIAHTADDQVETFILRMVKGTGIRGLQSIPLKRDTIIRPLLTSYRSEIAAYAHRYAIRFVEDSSNRKTMYERNFIRQEILPHMEKVNPRFREKIIDLLDDLSIINEFLNTQVADFLETTRLKMEDGIVLAADELNGLDGETRFRVLSNILMTMKKGYIPVRQHIRLIEKILRGRKPNLSITLPHGIRVKKSYNRVRFTHRLEEPVIEDIVPIREGINTITPFNLTLHVMEEVTRPTEFLPDHYCAYFDKDKIGNLYMRTFRYGDRFVPLGMPGAVKVKDFFISRKIPQEKRRHIPLLLSENDIIWVVGFRIDDRYKITEKTQHILKVVAEFLQ